MHIIELVRYVAPGERDTNVIAKFNVQVSDDLRLYGLKLVNTSNGRRTYFPSVGGGNRLASASVPLARKITELASRAAYEQGVA